MLVDCARKTLTGKVAKRRWNAPTSPATRTACRSIRKSPSSRPACVLARRPHDARLRRRRIPRDRPFDRRVLDGLRRPVPDGDNSGIEEAVKKDVIALTDRFPIYGYLG
jgi:hypothetical protein